MAIIDGKAIAVTIRQEIKADIVKHSLRPVLAIVSVGNSDASQIYVRNKQKACEEVGIDCEVHAFPANIKEDELIYQVQMLNSDFVVSGILIQLPLPNHINRRKVLETVFANKDVDGFTAINQGKLILNDESGFVPCTANACKELISRTIGSDLSGKNALVIGRSEIVGKPTAALLTQMNATVTLAHSKTWNLPQLCKNANIIVAAIGKPMLIQGKWIQDGATVIDVGINRVGGRIVGDVDFPEAFKHAAYITPVPKGVGPMTVAMLLKNVVKACKRGIVVHA